MVIEKVNGQTNGLYNWTDEKLYTPSAYLVCWGYKKGPKILLSDLWWFPDMSPGQNLCTTVFYSSLPLIWYAIELHVCLYIMDLGPFGAIPPGPATGLHQNSQCVPPVLIHTGYRLWKFQDSNLNGLGAMVWYYRWTDGRGGGGITISPLFLKKKHGDDYENDSPDTISYQEQFGWNKVKRTLLKFMKHLHTKMWKQAPEEW